MNTFVVKSLTPLNGQYIGMSKHDSQYVYVYRSHKVFKDANPNLDPKQFTILDEDKLEKYFNFRLNNICPICGGLKAFYHVSSDKLMNGKILYDEDGFTLFSEKICANCVCEDGTYIGYLEHELEMQNRQTNDARENFVELREYIQKTSTCKTCKGCQGHTLGLCACEECGLPGNGVWPG